MRSETDVTKAKDAGLPLPGGPQLLVLVKDQRVKEIRRQLAETEEIIRFVFPYYQFVFSVDRYTKKSQA